MFRPLMIGAALFVAAPALAQMQATNPADRPSTPLPDATAQDSSNARSDAIAAQTAPGVAAANEDVAAQARLQSGAAAAVNTANDARYRADVRRYRAAMRTRRQVIASDAALQADRERAYAMAMSDWREQVRACKKGHSRACKLPTPNPQNYM
ncbi:hypothetical protein LPN01_09980 [Sphingomonas sp. A2-49]|uniref:hypothetical protein n=1 Tax=Sphingomonas sp. A2-49 TaxID=1391375 RepID=UPI0021CF742A|nr:hypothetical protein [Sphingomonas sp. A2-49]MCU6454403.1 hypothetical protein [Sphingomonas sp. A2-49]